MSYGIDWDMYIMDIFITWSYIILKSLIPGHFTTERREKFSTWLTDISSADREHWTWEWGRWWWRRSPKKDSGIANAAAEISAEEEAEALRFFSKDKGISMEEKFVIVHLTC